MTNKDYQPFRYPGGKTKLACNPAFRALLDPLLDGADTFYEGFLGSAAVTLDIALRYPNLKFEACELDPTISGFWQLISEGTEAQVQELLILITQMPTVDLFKQLRNQSPVSVVERAYQAIFFNRTTFSGISMAQPIGGNNQISQWKIDCRYNTPLLLKKIKNLRNLFAGRLKIFHADVFNWLDDIPAGSPIYLDPPYFVKGDMLYSEKMSEFQHDKLADKLATKTNWVMSYDICDEIRNKYSSFAQMLEIDFRYSINGKKNNWKSSKEFLIVSPEIDTSPFEVKV